MIQITNMPRVIIRNEQPSPTTPVVDADDDHDDESIVSGDNNKPNTTSSSQTTTSTSSQSNVEDHHPQQSQDCFRRTNSSPPPSVKVTTSSSSSSLSVILPEKYDSSLEILQTLSSESMHAITKSKSADPDYDGSFRAGSSEQPSQIPRRNLTEAFEELYIKPSGSTVSNSESETPLAKPQKSSTMSLDAKVQVTVASMISPTGVTDMNMSASSTNVVTPTSKDAIVGKLDDKLGFHLHSLLQRDLSDDLVQRVSFYAIIHDINKECTCMAANDDSGYNRTPDEALLDYDPLIHAVNGSPRQEFTGGANALVTNALIDEEQWLLDTIEARNSEKSRNTVNACPATFSQAMGERDYENPLASLSSGSRTQLWKPSRSWWEAKSGKNPWIEPMCHNKRWRYLWPLIHYHKFLAKCIKKLKRNGVDVKTSVSPVAVFLREEVCAVSDHLAAVSLFDSDEWMDCLVHFNGWNESNETAQEQSRQLVAKLKLRSLFEPGDVDSPLLRSQIDEQYLRAMANARAQLTGADALAPQEKRPKDAMRRRDSSVKSKQATFGQVSSSRQAATPGHKSQLASAASPGMPPRHWHGYAHHPGWWQNGWHPSAYHYPDDGSVQSALSGETSYSHGYMNGYHPGSVPPGFYPPMMYPQPHMMHGSHHPSYEQQLGSIPDGSMYSPTEPYNSQHMTHGGWMGHPQMGYSMHHAATESPAVPVPATPARNTSENGNAAKPSPEELYDPHSTPYKYSPGQVHAMSPYWGHLDPMMGLATPQGPSAPATPHHGGDSALGSEEGSEEEIQHASSAQPLLLRQHYYGYGQYNPPSPASQFLMTPQAPADMGYGYTYGSPQRRPARRKPTSGVNDARNDVSEGGKTTSENATPLRPAAKQSRESPSQPETE